MKAAQFSNSFCNWLFAWESVKIWQLKCWCSVWWSIFQISHAVTMQMCVFQVFLQRREFPLEWVCGCTAIWVIHLWAGTGIDWQHVHNFTHLSDCFEWIKICSTFREWSHSPLCLYAEEQGLYHLQITKGGPWVFQTRHSSLQNSLRPWTQQTGVETRESLAGVQPALSHNLWSDVWNVTFF